MPAKDKNLKLFTIEARHVDDEYGSDEDCRQHYVMASTEKKAKGLLRPGYGENWQFAVIRIQPSPTKGGVL